jgi:dTDP-4-dehydrorhamnose 3,5-epimerase-like enzyme
MNGVESTIYNCHLISLKTVLRDEGKLTIVQNEKFDIKRAYYIYDVPDGSVRGNHAHKSLYQLIIPVNGSFRVILNDGIRRWNVKLRLPHKGLLVVPGIWRELDQFSEDAVCLVLASELYDESDYIRNYDEFIKYKNESV